MATEAQVVANRLNAQKSTGPRTSEGKAVASQNAVRHGLLAQQVVIRGEDPGEFEFYRQQMLGEMAPASAMESVLAERVVGLAWRLRRAERIQAEVFDVLLIEDETNPARKRQRSMRSEGADEDDSDLGLGRVVIRDFANYRVLDRLGLYERRIEQSLYRAVAELQKLRLLHELEPPKEADLTPEPVAQTDKKSLRQTNPISAFSAPKTGSERKGNARESQSSPVSDARPLGTGPFAMPNPTSATKPDDPNEPNGSGEPHFARSSALDEAGIAP